MTDNGKHSSLLRCGIIYGVKSFKIQTPDGANSIKHFKVVFMDFRYKLVFVPGTPFP